MPVPNSIDDLEPVPADNYPAGSEPVFPNLDNYLRAHAAFIAQLRDLLGTAGTEIETIEDAIEDVNAALALRVAKTSDTGIALLPEGNNAQRPATGSIPAGALVMRGNTQDPADYKSEFWDRVAAAWKVLADRTWVKVITDALGLRLSTLESRPITVAAANFSCITSITIRNSFGISSITRESAGVMTVNFSTPQPDTNYLVFCGGSSANGRFTRVQETAAGNTTPSLKTTTQVRLMHAAASTEPQDCSEIYVQIVRIQQ